MEDEVTVDTPICNGGTVCICSNWPCLKTSRSN